MKISTKGRYALRFLLFLATHSNDGFVSLKLVSEKENISKKYMEQIVPILNKTDIIITNRGAQGGYKLGRTADKITVGEVLRLAEGTLAPVSCINQNGIADCPRNSFCPTLPVWTGLNKVINEYLDGITLQDIIDQSASFTGDNYVI